MGEQADVRKRSNRSSEQALLGATRHIADLQNNRGDKLGAARMFFFVLLERRRVDTDLHGCNLFLSVPLV